MTVILQMRLTIHTKTLNYLEKERKWIYPPSNKVNKDLSYGLISESSHVTLRSVET
jgi:hypothetical protein